MTSKLPHSQASAAKLPRGVTHIKHQRLKKPYKAQINIGNRGMRNLGYYATPEEAHEAWKQAAAKRAEARGR